jgi:citrate lyase subunit beta/citryl-CoA lyase
MRSPRQFEHPLLVRAKADVASAALAHGVMPSHNVCTELVDTAVIEGDARRARCDFGYLRMWSIHPNQLEPILRGMQPAHGEVSEAGDIVCAAQDAQWHPIRHGTRLHDRASYRYYWSTLKRARATGVALDAEVEGRFFV